MDVNEIVGMEEIAAKKKLLEAGYTSMTTERDGNKQAVILIACHFYLTVENGKVTAFRKVG